MGRAIRISSLCALGNEFIMDDRQKLIQDMEADMFTVAQRYSFESFKILTYNFDRTYKRNDDGGFDLVLEKATIRSYGKVTKVPISENEQYKTFEDAEKGVQKYWVEYYKKVREKRSEKDKLLEAKRQKKYRDKRRAAELQLREQQ